MKSRLASKASKRKAAVRAMAWRSKKLRLYGQKAVQYLLTDEEKEKMTIYLKHLRGKK